MRCFQAVLVISVLWAVVFLFGCDGQTCSTEGRFGSNCKYLCHCEPDPNCYLDDGRCHGWRCDIGWFGPSCQYGSASFSPTQPWSADRNCYVGSVQSVNVTLDSPQPLTWIRVWLGRRDVPLHDFQVDVTFLDGRVETCSSGQSLKIGYDAEVDISCSTSDKVETVALTGAVVPFLCYLDISRGRNIALLAPGYNVTQSSTYRPEDGWGPENAVDGLYPPGSEDDITRALECTQTERTESPSTSWWELTFGARSFNIYTFVIHNRKDSNQEHLQGFVLTAYSGDQVLYDNTDDPPGVADIYTIVPSPRIDKPVDRVTVELSETLTLCEVLIYGDCPTNSYGFECDQPCNCADQRACLPTGACPYGCAPGYTGDTCQTPCDPGWFGTNCMYMCHCGEGDNCHNVTGACPDDMPCERGWFGPACQYESVSYSSSISWLTDNDDASCNSNSSDQAVSVTLDTPQPLTWIRVVVSGTDIQIDVTYALASNPGVTTFCPIGQSAMVDDTTIDISCPTDNAVMIITLSGSGVVNLCSLYISGGRNVALKQTSVSQSSTYGPEDDPLWFLSNSNIYWLPGYWLASNAVDGALPTATNYSDPNEMCIQTTSVVDPSWELTFKSHSYDITKFVLHSRSDQTNRVQGSSLRAYGMDATVPMYDFHITLMEDVHTIIPSPRMAESVERVTVSYDDGLHHILEFCEILMYGDCPINSYGLKCDQPCYCADQRACFPTGTCPNGCAPGYTGDTCQNECFVGLHGQNCLEECSYHCTPPNRCDHVNGTCKCEPGYQPPLCQDACPVGTYGQDCVEACSVHCVGGLVYCSHVDGSCEQGCDTGYQPPLCMEAVPEGESVITTILDQLDQENITASNINETIDALGATIDSVEPEEVTATDVTLIADVLEKVTIAAATSDTAILSPDTVEETLLIVDQVSHLPQTVLVAAQASNNSNNIILAATDNLGVLLTIPNGTNHQRVISGGIGLEVWDLSSQDQDSETIYGIKLSEEPQEVITEEELVSQFAGQNVQYNTTDAAIYLPEQLLKEYKEQVNSVDSNISEFRLIFNVYKATSLYRYPETTGLTVNQTLNSRVIAAQLVVNGQQVRDLQGHKVRTVFHPQDRALAEDERANITSCVYWNFTAKQGAGAWREDGCDYSRTVDGRDVCECDHLTNFAILVNYYGPSKRHYKEHKEILGYITIIGLSLSIICLGLSMLSFLCIKKLREKLPYQVLFQLSLALIFSWITFLAGIERTSNRNVCIAVGALLHYLILASFMWMLMEGLMQYLMFVNYMKPYIRNILLRISIVSWVLPALVVGVVCAIDYELYHAGEDFCWMKKDAFLYAFAIPVGIILTINLVIFIVVTVNLWRRKDMSKHSSKKSDQRIVNLRASFISFVLLGLCWIFGFLAIEETGVVFQYLFCIFATLQGFIIFIMMTARDPYVRQYWMKCACLTRDKFPAPTSSTRSRTGSQDTAGIEYRRRRSSALIDTSALTHHKTSGSSLTFPSGSDFENCLSMDSLTEPPPDSGALAPGSESLSGNSLPDSCTTETSPTESDTVADRKFAARF